MASTHTHHQTWQEELVSSFKSMDTFLDNLGIDPASLPYTIERHHNFPFFVSRFFASLIDARDPHDPLLKQVLIQSDENIVTPGYKTDPLEEASMRPQKGITHKYKHRALLMLSGACAINCRYCFRRHSPYHEITASLKNISYIQEYCHTHQIREIIFSGGDPLLLGNKQIKQWCDALREADVELIRIHSRLPSVLPNRIDDGFIEIATTLGYRLAICYHINHAQECHPLIAEKALALKKAGVRTYNQSVLLRGINDSPDTLTALSHTLIAHHIQPYYLHQMDPVQGAAHFAVPKNKGKEILQQMMAICPGYLVPKYVEEVPYQSSKTHI